MGTRLFIGNLSYAVTEQELREAFTGDGIELRSVRVALDRETGRPRGFAFVETMTDDGAKASIEKLSGRVLQGRPIIVEEAQAKPAGPRPGGFGGAAAPRRLRRPAAGRPGRRPRRTSARSRRPRRLRRRAPARRLRRPASSGRRRTAPADFGPPRGPGGFRAPTRAAAPAAAVDAAPRRERERPEKKKSTRPKPEERERGNWRWDRNPDDE